MGLVGLWCALWLFALGVVWLCGLIFRLVWAFRGVGLALVWVLVALRLVGRLNGSERLRVASAVIWGVDGVRGRGIPTRMANTSS